MPELYFLLINLSNVDQSFEKWMSDSNLNTLLENFGKKILENFIKLLAYTFGKQFGRIFANLWQTLLGDACELICKVFSNIWEYFWKMLINV